ncbi:hypothetical protein GCM10009775_22190 [Microbacterium aoyamense]|uniref:Uncharacterized protein n=1 Tax=Microbacterium aoyamense TaxID=344166 RepID=A0ABP5B3M9_9MICO
MVLRLTNPGPKRARVKVVARTEDAEQPSRFNAELSLDQKGLVQVDAFRTRSVRVDVRPRQGTPAPSGPLELARLLVWLELDSDQAIVPGGEVVVERTLLAELNDALPVTFDSQAIQWFELDPPSPATLLPRDPSNEAAGTPGQNAADRPRRPRRDEPSQELPGR